MDKIKGFEKFVNENYEPINEKDYSKETRDEMAEKGEALKDGSFPISNKTDLTNAIKSQGRGLRNASPARKKEVLAHISKRAKALGVDLEKTEKGNWKIKK